MNLSIESAHTIGYWDLTASCSLAQEEGTRGQGGFVPGLIAGGDYHNAGSGRYFPRPSVIKYDADPPTEVLGSYYDSSPNSEPPVAVCRLSDTKFVLFTQQHAWVCVWNGTSISKGAMYNSPYPGKIPYVAALTGSVFVLVSEGIPIAKTQVRIGIVNGTAITFYNSTTTGLVEPPRSVCRLDDDRFAFAVSSSPRRIYVGTRSGGTTVTIGNPVGVDDAGPYTDLRVVTVSPDYLLCSYQNATWQAVARLFSADGLSLTSRDTAIAGAPGSSNARWQIGVLPPVDSAVWPRFFVYPYVSGNPNYKLYCRVGSVSSAGELAWEAAAIYTGITEDYPYDLPGGCVDVLPIGSKRFVLSYQYGRDAIWNRLVRYVEITDWPIDLGATLGEALSVDGVSRRALAREFSGALGLAECVDVVPNKIVGESLSLSDSATFLSALVRVLIEDIPLVDSLQAGGTPVWTLKEDFSNKTPAQDGVLSLAYDSAHEVLVAGTRLDGQLWASTDGAETWVLKKDFSDEAPPKYQVHALVYDPVNEVLVAAVDSQLWISADGAETWTLKKDLWLEAIPQSKIYSLVYDPVYEVLVAGTFPDSQIWASPNGGNTWAFKQDLGQGAVHCLVYDTAHAVIIAGTGYDGELWASTDGAETWTEKKGLGGEDPPQYDVYSLAYDPVHEVVVAGTSPNAQIWASSDGGKIWTMKVDLNLFPDQIRIHALVHNPASGMLIAGTSPNAQIWASSDGAETWALQEDLSLKDPSQTYVYALACDAGHEMLVAGTYPDAQVWTWARGGATFVLVKTISDLLGLNDQVLRNPHKRVEEIIAICERLRLGDVFDNPTTRIITAILKAALMTERL